MVIESVPYNPASIDDVNADRSDVSVIAEGLAIRIEGETGVTAGIYRIDGTLAGHIASGEGEFHVAAPGVYVVRYVTADGIEGHSKVSCRL